MAVTGKTLRDLIGASVLCLGLYTGSTSAQTRDCWIDAATGKPVAIGPVGWSPSGRIVDHVYSNPDPNHVEGGGRTVVRLGDGSWIDAATGKPVPTGPVGWSPTGRIVDHVYSNPDPNHVEGGGRTAVRVPCPPPTENATGTPMMPPAVGTGEPHKTDTGSRDDNPDDKKTTTTSAKPDTPAKTDTPAQSSTAPANPKTIEKQDTAVDHKTIKPEQPKSSAIKTKTPTGEKRTSTKTPQSKSASHTASKSKKTKKEEDKVQVHIEFFSTKSGGGSFSSGGFGR